MKRILATLIFFTRLPLWRLTDIPREYYERVVPLWPIVGWVTGGAMATVYYVCHTCVGLPIQTAVIASLIARVLITGALHEDGFADFCDGFGGGTTRERTLEIMKDSHIGTYGVLGLILYALLMYNVLTPLLFATTPLIFIVADTMSKYFSSTIVYFLPYARKESEAKNKLIYQQVRPSEKVLSLLLALAPLMLVWQDMQVIGCALAGMITAAATCCWLFCTMRHRIQGYTGDCCGATFIITECLFYLSMLIWTYCI